MLPVASAMTVKSPGPLFCSVNVDLRFFDVGAIELRVEVGLGLLLALVRLEIERLLGDHQGGGIERGLHRGARRIGAAVVDRDADGAEDRNEGEREDDVTLPPRSARNAAVCRRDRIRQARAQRRRNGEPRGEMVDHGAARLFGSMPQTMPTGFTYRLPMPGTVPELPICLTNYESRRGPGWDAPRGGRRLRGRGIRHICISRATAPWRDSAAGPGRKSLPFAEFRTDFVNYESRRARAGRGSESPCPHACQGVHEIRRFVRERFAASFRDPRSRNPKCA